MITFTGPATVQDFEFALSTVTYFNSAEEPMLVAKTISFVVNDGMAPSNTANGTVIIALVNDNELVLMCSPAQTSFVEDSSSPQAIANGLVLMDLDQDHMITNATISIAMPASGDLDVLSVADTSSVGVEIVINQISDTALVLYGDAMASDYQVHLLVLC